MSECWTTNHMARLTSLRVRKTIYNLIEMHEMSVKTEHIWTVDCLIWVAGIVYSVWTAAWVTCTLHSTSLYIHVDSNLRTKYYLTQSLFLRVGLSSYYDSEVQNDHGIYHHQIIHRPKQLRQICGILSALSSSTYLILGTFIMLLQCSLAKANCLKH